MARDRRPRDDDEDEDDRPRRKRRPADEDDEDEEPRPKKKPRVVNEDEDEEERPRRKARVRDDDEDEDEEDRPRRRRKKPAGMSRGLLFGLIGGGVALVGVVVLLIVFLGGGSSPKSVMQRLIKAAKAKDYGTLYDNMSSRMQQSAPRMPGVTATDPRERFIESMKAAERMGGGALDKEGDAEALSETIIGDTATVKVRNSNGREADVPFIKENGRWKLNGR